MRGEEAGRGEASLHTAAEEAEKFRGRSWQVAACASP